MRRRKPQGKPILRKAFGVLGIGIVYHMVFIPRLIACKTGFTGWSIGNRRKSVSKAAPGWAIPIFFVAMPFAYQLEQVLLFLLSGLRHDFYKGDGHTETHFSIATFIVLPIFVTIWWVEYELFVFLRDEVWHYLAY